jgi:Immunity protein 52
MSRKFHNYTIAARWGLRGETPEALADRTRRLILRFQMINPVLAHWYDWPSGTRAVPLDLALQSLTGRIADAVPRDDDGTPFRRGGYHFWFLNHNTTKEDSRSFALRIRAGSEVYDSFITLGSNDLGPPDPDVVTYKVFKAALLAISECFEATYCDAFPSDLMDLWPDGGRQMHALRLAWISYVSPRFAPLVTPPPTALVEYRPDGGLLMAATDETFRTANPKHLAVAQDILAAAAPLNANPWPDEEQR